LGQRGSVRSAYGKNISLSEIWDHHVSKFPFELYPQDESMGTVAAREYRQELETRAAAGDKYAISALQSMDEGKGVVGFDDAG
jgi:hypothetical protein